MSGRVVHTSGFKYHVRIDLYGNDEDIDSMEDAYDYIMNKVSKGLARWM
ncbi:MAG: hypothetical protein H7836_13150 [Magnetococcus sp. YQC-3]